MTLDEIKLEIKKQISDNLTLRSTSEEPMDYGIYKGKMLAFMEVLDLLEDLNNDD